MIVAIDPGTSGCIAIMGMDGQLHAFLHTPTIKVGSKNRVNGAAIAAFLAGFSLTHCYLEQVQAVKMGGRKQGVSSMFTFGHSAGLVEGVVTGAGIPLTLVSPQRWKKHAGLIGSDKDAARSRAIQLYPSVREFDLKGKGQALADAVFIGLCGLGLKAVSVVPDGDGVKQMDIEDVCNGEVDTQ